MNIFGLAFVVVIVRTNSRKPFSAPPNQLAFSGHKLARKRQPEREDSSFKLGEPIAMRRAGAKIYPAEKQESYYGTKLHGLNVLEQVSKATHCKILPKKVFDSPSEFSINLFEKPSEGRLIVRSDPKTIQNRQTMQDWVKMPRMNLTIDRQNPLESERIVREWMEEQSTKWDGKIRFIVHKVRLLEDYDKSVQINATLGDLNNPEGHNGRIVFSVGEASSDKFRDEKVKQYNFDYDVHRRRIRRIFGEEAIPLSEQLRSMVLQQLNAVVDVAMQQGEKSLELNFVTYKDAPHEPEFYDLIFGKAY